MLFAQILGAKRAKDLPLLNELSLSRVYRHVLASTEQSFGILTSWRAGAPPNQNKTNFKRLQQQIRALGLGFFKLVGHWGDQEEPSLFIPGIKYEDIRRLSIKWEQEAFIYSGPETDGKVTLHFGNGSHKERLGDFTPGKIAAAYSQVKGHPFVFEYVANSMAEAMYERRHAMAASS